MSLVTYISSRFNRHRTLPPSLKTMRLIAIVGIAIASATLVITLSILKGFEREYKRTILDFNAHLVLMKAGEVDDGKRVDGLIGQARQNMVLIGATPFIYREGLLISRGTIKGVVVKGVDAQTLRDVNPMRIDLYDAPSLNEVFGNDASNRVILGSELAKQLHLDGGRGGSVKLLVPTTKLAKGDKNFQELEVVGTFESGLYDFDSQFALMSLESVRSLFEIGGEKVTGIELKLGDPERASALGVWFEENLGMDWRAIPWSELNSEIFKAVQIEKRTFSIIIGMMVVVAAFNIIVVLTLIILMRLNELSVLRSLGVTKCNIRQVLTRGGLTIGFFGILFGIPLGIAAALALKTFNLVHIAPEIYFLSRLPIDISPAVCGMIALFSLAVCWGISKLASRTLTNIPIVEGLKGND